MVMACRYGDDPEQFAGQHRADLGSLFLARCWSGPRVTWPFVVGGPGNLHFVMLPPQSERQTSHKDRRIRAEIAGWAGWSSNDMVRLCCTLSSVA